MNLFDVMRSAGGGDAFSLLAAQYRLTEEQVARAAEAFSPAFSAGLKRRTGAPQDLMHFLQTLAAGSWAQAWRDPAWAAGSGRREGEEALSLLFGSPEVARAVAGLASAVTGLATEKLAELMPAFAALAFGGLAQQATQANPLFAAMLKQMQAGAPAAAQPAARAAAAAKGPLDRYEEEQARRERETAVPSGPALFGEMLEPAQRLGEAYRAEMFGLLERMLPPPRAR